MQKNNIRYYLKLFALVALLFASTAKPVQALELGLTPSHVYGLWLNINNVYIQLQKEKGITDEKLKHLQKMEPNNFKGKEPSDVLERSRQIQESLITLFSLKAVKPTPDWVIHFQDIEGANQQTSVTPSEVYILASWILNNMVEQYAETTHGAKPISSFYKEHSYTNMMPSDVFALVDLFSRRMKEYK